MQMWEYNSFLVYCREFAPGTVSLTGDWAQGDDSKHDSQNSVYNVMFITMYVCFFCGLYSYTSEHFVLLSFQ